jgi:hypothetical protein
MSLGFLTAEAIMLESREKIVSFCVCVCVFVLFCFGGESSLLGQPFFTVSLQGAMGNQISFTSGNIVCPSIGLVNYHTSTEKRKDSSNCSTSTSTIHNVNREGAVKKKKTLLGVTVVITRKMS